jgi:transposase InsO family protein
MSTRQHDQLPPFVGVHAFIAELTSMAILAWSKGTGVDRHYIQTGKPQQNAFVESFNALRAARIDVLHYTRVTKRDQRRFQESQSCPIQRLPNHAY